MSWSLLLVHAWRIPLSSKLKAPCSSIPPGHLSESWPRGTVPWSSIPLVHFSESWPGGKRPLAASLQFTSLKADPGEQLLAAESLQFTSLKAAAASVQFPSLEQPSLQAQPGARKMLQNFGKRDPLNYRIMNFLRSRGCCQPNENTDKRLVSDKYT